MLRVETRVFIQVPYDVRSEPALHICSRRRELQVAAKQVRHLAYLPGRTPGFHLASGTLEHFKWYQREVVTEEEGSVSNFIILRNGCF